MTDRPQIIAYRTGAAMPLVPGAAVRQWMNDTKDHFANRCLPLRIANQAGWYVLNDKPFAVSWDGGTGRSSLTIRPLRDNTDVRAISFSGHGILTFLIPYLFRTSVGFNLLARGPANLPKDGISPLEGLVETDWAVASFTMSWKVTRPDVEITFDVGEPICMIVPQRRGELEEFETSVEDIEGAADLAEQHELWAASRHRRSTETLQAIIAGKPSESPPWELDYIRGTSPGGASGEDHQTKLRLASFIGRT